MILAKYLRAESIVIGLKAGEKWAAIDELLNLLDRQDLIADTRQVRQALIQATTPRQVLRTLTR